MWQDNVLKILVAIERGKIERDFGETAGQLVDKFLHLLDYDDSSTAPVGDGAFLEMLGEVS